MKPLLRRGGLSGKILFVIISLMVLAPLSLLFGLRLVQRWGYSPGWIQTLAGISFAAGGILFLGYLGWISLAWLGDERLERWLKAHRQALVRALHPPRVQEPSRQAGCPACGCPDAPGADQRCPACGALRT